MEDNDNYKKCKAKERLIVNLANTHYFIIKFVFKSLFNFKGTWKQQDPEQMDNWDFSGDKPMEDWDIFWTDGGVLPERISKMKPY